MIKPENVNHTRDPAAAGRPVPKYAVFPEDCDLSVITNDSGDAGALLTFTTYGKKTAYFIGEAGVAGLQFALAQVLPVITGHNKPKDETP